MRPFRHLLVLAFAAVFVAPAAVADHPGSNRGLAGLVDAVPGAGPGGDRLVHRVVDVDEAFARWESEWPDFVARFTIGESRSGLPLLGVVVTDERVAPQDSGLSTGTKLRIYLDGGHHGNEYLGVELVMYWLEELLSNASGGDEAALALLATNEIHAVPMVNPEGNLFDTRKNGAQVDLNRNYPFEWGGPGSGDLPAEFTYRGPEALSEPESAANAAYGAGLSPDVWVTMHTGVSEFYWPWGWTHDASPDDEMFRKIEAPFEAATNGRVDAMQGAELYLAAGATDDYAYGALGVPGFTYEVHDDQFIPAYGEPIPDVIRDQLAGLDWIVGNARYLGAWVEPAVTAEGLVLENVGWGVARNVTVGSGPGATVVEEIAPGASVVVPFTAGGSNVAISYPPLLVESSRIRTHVLGAVPGDLGGLAAELPVPGLEVAAAFAVLAVVALARRRRFG